MYCIARHTSWFLLFLSLEIKGIRQSTYLFSSYSQEFQAVTVFLECLSCPSGCQLLCYTCWYEGVQVRTCATSRSQPTLLTYLSFPQLRLLGISRFSKHHQERGGHGSQGTDCSVPCELGSPFANVVKFLCLGTRDMESQPASSRRPASFCVLYLQWSFFSFPVKGTQVYQ